LNLLDFARTVSIAVPIDRRADGLPSARHPPPGAVRARGGKRAAIPRRFTTEEDIMTTSRKRSRRHLSDTALVLLGRAADSENQMLLPIPRTVKAHGKALEGVLRSLLNQEFVEEIPVGLADEAWRSGDDGRLGLRITESGLRAIGVPALMSGFEQMTAVLCCHVR
jgi:hypothetical protein